MTQIKLKPLAQVESTLYDVYDVQDETTYKGTGFCIYYGDYLGRENRVFDLKKIERDDAYNTYFIYVTTDGANNIPVSEEWIDSILVDNIEYKITNNDWFTTHRIRTNVAHTFISLPDFTVTFDDSCCTICGSYEHVDPTHKICSKCIDKALEVHSYNYKPTPTFFGEGKKHYGIELEFGFTSKKQAAKIVVPNSTKVYLKQDSSIRGGTFKAELVSHPHTFEELMAPTSYLNALDSATVEKNENNGCHIHISRTAFDSQKHFGLFYFLMYSSKQLLELVGGRKLNNYCAFSYSGHVATKENLPSPTTERGRVINEQNEKTIEVRIFDSINNASRVKSYVQFLDSIIEYTRDAKVTVSITKYLAYVAANQDKYSELYAIIKDFKSPDKGTVVYKKPTIKTTTISKLPLSDLSLIISITTFNNEVYKLDTNRPIDILKGSHVQYYGRRHLSNGDISGNSSFTIPLADITSVEIAK